MIGQFCILSILVTVTLGSETTMTCPQGLSPQLSTTFLNGFWYEHLFTNTVLNQEPCSHFEINCNSSSTSCKVQNVKWNSYLLDEIWNGTIAQHEKDSTVDLIINRENFTSTFEVNLKFQEDAVLIWACNGTNLEFASVLVRMVVDDEMESVWNKAFKNMNYLSITEDAFPAGIWKKIDPTECSSGFTTLQHRSSKLLAVIILHIITVQKQLM